MFAIRMERFSFVENRERGGCNFEKKAQTKYFPFNGIGIISHGIDAISM